MDAAASLLDLFLHIDRHLADAALAYGPWIYAILFGIVFLETGVVVTPFLPGDSLLFAAGVLAASGILDVGLVIALLLVAAVLGDSLNYAIGRNVGPRVFTEGSRLFKQEHLLRTQRFYERHGGKAIVLARFVPIVRTFAPFVAGIGRMSYRRFAFYNVLGAVLWVTGLTALGYFFGAQPIVKENFSLVIMAIIALSLLPLAVEVLRTRGAWSEPSAPRRK